MLQIETLCPEGLFVLICNIYGPICSYAPKGHLGFESPALRQFKLKEGFHLGPFFSFKSVSRGFEPSKNEAPRWTPHLVRCDIALALHLRSLGYGLALGCERSVVDAAAQAVELHEQPLDGIGPRSFLVGD